MSSAEPSHLLAIYERLMPRRQAYTTYLLDRYYCEADRTIAPDDAMRGDDVNAYLLAGLSALHAIDVALQAAERRTQDVRRILDLPCGHGRVLRMLRAVFADSEIVACDIERSGVDFCAHQFGAVPVYSSPDIDRIELPGRFDLIWVGSLFTHIDAPQWHGFLRLFSRLLEPGGVLVFTAAGRFVTELLRAGELGGLSPTGAMSLLGDLDRDGFGFAEYASDDAAQSEQQRYGRAVAQPRWVTSLLAAYPEFRLVGYREQAWDLRQDVIAAVKDR